MGKRTDALMRIFHADNSVDQYRAELNRLVKENIHRQNRQEVLALAEAKFAEYKRKQTQLELDAILEKYGDAKPEPTRTGTRYTLKGGWGGEDQDFTGTIQTAPDPRSVAHGLNSPLAALERRKGNRNVETQLRGVLGQLQGEVEENASKQKIARALIAALEVERTAPPVKAVLYKLPPEKAGVLPRRNSHPRYEGRWLPESQREKDLAAALYPEYKKFLALPDKIDAEDLSEDLYPWYSARDPLREAHDKIVSEYMHRQAMGDPQLRWQIITPDVSKAVEDADEFLGIGKV
jgi:hypothetical protein